MKKKTVLPITKRDKLWCKKKSSCLHTEMLNTIKLLLWWGAFSYFRWSNLVLNEIMDSFVMKNNGICLLIILEKDQIKQNRTVFEPWKKWGQIKRISLLLSWITWLYLTVKKNYFSNWQLYMLNKYWNFLTDF